MSRMQFRFQWREVRPGTGVGAGGSAKSLTQAIGEAVEYIANAAHAAYPLVSDSPWLYEVSLELPRHGHGAAHPTLCLMAPTDVNVLMEIMGGMESLGFVCE